MSLTPAQLPILKAAILAETDAGFVAARAVGNDEVGRAFIASGLSAMTAGNNDRLVSFALWNPGGVQPFRQDHRQFFDDVFSPTSGATTRAALWALWKRNVTRGERLYATGTGSDAVPGLLVFEGVFSDRDIQDALAV